LDYGSQQRQDSSSATVLAQPTDHTPIAFILYRQHHQQGINARNPGLNNPDISKIIGEQWKAEGDEQKKVWQELAQVSSDCYIAFSFLC
jgi:hypothetical protein